MIGGGLTLITGNTGSGKTALLVKWMLETKGRPFFVHGIPELKVEHLPCPPLPEWTELRPDEHDPALKMPYFTFPANAIVIADEAQRIFPTRPVGSRKPDFVAAFETRRHTGVDFVLLTQDPSFIDAHIRKLVKRHVHIHETPLGRFKLEWVGCGDPSEKASRELAQRERYSPDKKVFGLYKSAEQHTKTIIRRPWLVYAFPLLLIGLGVGGWHIKNRVSAGFQAEPVAENKAAGSLAQTGRGRGDAPMTRADYVAQFEPRVAGLPHTAPAYDGVTAVAVAPEPVGCVESRRTGCKCYTQQGTPYETTQDICRQIMAGGLWMPWKVADKGEQGAMPEKPATAPPDALAQPSRERPVAVFPSAPGSGAAAAMPAVLR